MKLSQLQAVLAVAECGSLRAAGRHLRIAQPSITRSIREIERELGVSLFERTAKGVRATHMGGVFLRRAEAIRAELQRATDEIEQLKGQSNGQVSIAMSDASCLALLPKAMAGFRKQYPDAVIKVTEGVFRVVEQDVLGGGLDFYVGPIDPDASNARLLVDEMYLSQRVIVGRKGHPLLKATTLAELKNARWLRPTLCARNTEADFSAMLSGLGLPDPRIVVQGATTLTTLPLLVHSDLLTVLPASMLESEIFSGALEAVSLQEKIPEIAISIVRRHDMPLTPMAEHLRDHIRRIGLGLARTKSSRGLRSRGRVETSHRRLTGCDNVVRH